MATTRAEHLRRDRTLGWMLRSAISASHQAVEPEGDTYQLRRARGVGYAVAEFSRACLIRLIDFPEMPFRISTRETIKAGRTALLVRAELPMGDRMIPVAYKRVRRRNWLKLLTGLLRTNRTLRTWQLGHEFLRRGIRTARPLAVIVPRLHNLARGTFLATEWLEGAVNLHACYRSLQQQPAAERARLFGRVACSLGELLGRMHAASISHRDLKVANLLVRACGAELETYVIDLDGAELRSRLSRRVQLRNLSRLAVSIQPYDGIGLTIRLRFLKAYLTALAAPDWPWKDAWRQLARHSARRRAA